MHRIGTHHIFYRIFLKHITKYAYQVFGAVAEGNWCFILISILSASYILQAFFLCIFCVVFEFFILFFSFCINLKVKITMDPIIELTNALAHLEQQLRMRQLDDENQRRVPTKMRSQVWQPYASMDYAQYEGTLYMSKHNFGWSHHPNTSWNTSYTTPQVQRLGLDKKMAELSRMHVELAVKNAERSRPRAEMDYSQVRLPTFLDQNEESQLP